MLVGWFLFFTLSRLVATGLRGFLINPKPFGAIFCVFVVLVFVPGGAKLNDFNPHAFSYFFLRGMIIPMLCVTIFVILVVWFLLPRVARLMIHTPTAISIFVCLSMVQLMAVFISMRCTLCGHFLQVALTLILVVGYAIAAS